MLRALPVESLAVTLHGGDLTPLEGLQHLTSLDLTTTDPTDVTPLRTAINRAAIDAKAMICIYGPTGHGKSFEAAR